MPSDLEELVALINARMPEAGPFRIDPARDVVLARHWSDHYWTLTDGSVRHQWMQVKPDERTSLRDPFILWTEDCEVALQRILAVERRQMTGVGA